MFDRLLVPLDGSPAAEAALAYAELIPGRAVRLLAVVAEDDAPDLTWPVAPRYDEWRAAETTRLETYLARVGEPLGRQGRQVTCRVEEGDPADRIVEAAAEADLIVMTTHGRGGGSRALFGSIADRVVRHAPAPVLVVRGGDRPVTPPPLTRIVVPLDGSALSECALIPAVDLADDLGVPLHLVRTLDVDRLRETVRAGTYAATAYARSLDEVRAAVADYLRAHELRLRGRDLRITSEVLNGAPAAELEALSRPGDLIVLTTHGRSGLRRWLLGSVADKLVRHASVPVLVVRACHVEDGEDGAG